MPAFSTFHGFVFGCFPPNCATPEAWEALTKTLKAIGLAALRFLSDGLNWKSEGN
jgi:hypothetical protein